jgi:hypothetical protein
MRRILCSSVFAGTHCRGLFPSVWGEQTAVGGGGVGTHLEPPLAPFLPLPLLFPFPFPFPFVSSSLALLVFFFFAVSVPPSTFEPFLLRELRLVEGEGDPVPIRLLRLVAVDERVLVGIGG